MNATMRAWRATSATDPLRFDEVEVPELGPDDVLVRVASAGISPMPFKLLRAGQYKHFPSTPGHEIAGVVEAVGDRRNEGWIGERVRVHPLLTCRNCVYCRTDREQMCDEFATLGAAAQGLGPHPLYERYHDGGLAEFVRVPVWLLDRIPEHVSFDVAAKLHDFGNAYRALTQANIPAGGTILITAATGAMATACLKLAPHLGAGRVVLLGRSRQRLAAVEALAEGVGVDSIALENLPSGWEEGDGLRDRIRELVPGGPDSVLDFLAASPATAQVLRSLRIGGTFLHMGGNPEQLKVPLRILMVNLWTVVGTRTCTRDDVDAVLGLLRAGALQVDDLITHRWALADMEAALEAVETRSEPIWMGVLHP